MKLLLTVVPFFMALIVGCASTPEAPPAAASTPPPRPKLRIVRREPGSLWTEDSRWNDLFSVAPTRILGDMLRVRINDTLRKKLAVLLDPQKTIGSSKESLAQAALERRVLGNEDPRAKEPDTDFLDVSITEVLPRSVFAITTRQLVKMGTVESRVELTGNIKEKDISKDDIVESDAILNVNVATTILPGTFKPGEAVDLKAVDVAEKAIKGGTK